MDEQDTTTERLIIVPEWFAAPASRYQDVASALRAVYTSVTDAEDYAAGLGVTSHYGSHLEIGNFANELLAQLVERNLPLPLSVVVHTDFFARYPRAIAMGEHGTLFINSGAGFWTAPLTTTISLHQSRFWSTPHPLHVLYHEVGHLLQSPQRARQKPLTPREAGIADTVSDRAKQDADEFVAEVFAGLMSAVKYDADILRLYRRLGGKML